jgi:hypothetical protein
MLEELHEPLGDGPFGQERDSYAVVQEPPDHLIGHLKNVGMGLEAVGGRIQDHPLGDRSFPGKFCFQKIRQINIELDFSCLRGLTISAGITVRTTKETSICDVKGGDSPEAAEPGRRKDFSFSKGRNDSEILHGTNLPRKNEKIHPFFPSERSVTGVKRLKAQAGEDPTN